MASSSSAKAGERILPLAALDFSSGVFGIDPLVRRRAGEGASEVTLEDEMRHHGVFFDQLLTMIPAQYYLKDEEAAEEQWKSRFWRNKKETAPKQAVKEKSKAARRARYDLESKKSLPLLIADRQAAHKRSREEDAGDGAEGFEGGFPTQAPGGRAASVEELRARLRARIEELRSKRQASDKGGKAAKGKEPRSDGGERPSAKRPRQDDEAAKAAAAATPAGEDVDGSLAFGTVSSVPRGMAGIKAKEMAAAQRKKRASLSTLLEKAEAHRSRVEALKGTEEGEKVRGEHDWDAALRRATGEKVRDDPKLLKRSIKREERSKKKSATKWRDRETQKTEEREARQAKREENLKKRSQGKGGKAKAAPKAGGKGGSKGGKPKAKARSGFEGSTRKSLN